MGNRRMGRKRLFAVNKKGQSISSDSSAGAGMTNGIVSQTIVRAGHEVVTEIAVDLGSSKGTFRIGADGAAGGHGQFPVGEDATTGSYLTKLTAAENGFLVAADMICTELPVGGTANLDLVLADSATGSHSTLLQNRQVLVNAGGDWELGDFKSFTSGTIQVSGGKIASGNVPDSQTKMGLSMPYLYLGHGDSPDGAQAAGSYTAGKYVIRLYGIVEPDSI